MYECEDTPTLTATYGSKISGVPKTRRHTVSAACKFDTRLNTLPYLLFKTVMNEIYDTAHRVRL